MHMISKRQYFSPDIFEQWLTEHMCGCRGLTACAELIFLRAYMGMRETHTTLHRLSVTAAVNKNKKHRRLDREQWQFAVAKEMVWKAPQKLTFEQEAEAGKWKWAGIWKQGAPGRERAGTSSGRKMTICGSTSSSSFPKLLGARSYLAIVKILQLHNVSVV